jgi:hypothetical protein
MAFPVVVDVPVVVKNQLKLFHFGELHFPNAVSMAEYKNERWLIQ